MGLKIQSLRTVARMYEALNIFERGFVLFILRQSKHLPPAFALTLCWRQIIKIETWDCVYGDWRMVTVNLI